MSVHKEKHDKVLCPECGWPLAGAYHQEVHPRMVRYDFDVMGVDFTAVRDWEDWSPEWQEHFAHMVAADAEKLATKGQWALDHYWITAYNPTTETMNFHVDLKLVV